MMQNYEHTTLIVMLTAYFLLNCVVNTYTVFQKKTCDHVFDDKLK